MTPDGISFDLDNPKYRRFRNGDNILEYTRDGHEITVDWVNGTNAALMLKRILEAEGESVIRISGYVTDKLGRASDSLLTRFGKQMIRQLGNEWSATVENIEGRRYLVFKK